MKKTELSLTTSNISKPNGSEHPKLTTEKEQDDTKQADKDKESQEISKHPPNNAPNITKTNRHTAKQKAPIKSIDTSTASTTTRINTSELSVMNTPISNKTPFPETTQKLPATEITLGYTSLNLTALEVVTVLTILLVTHFTITYQLQEQLIWLHGIHSMDLLNHLWRHPLISLEPQNLRKKSKASRCKTNKIHLKQGKSLRLPEQERQYDARSATTRRADRGSPGTQTRSQSPKHRISNSALLLLIATAIPLIEGSALKLDLEAPPHGYTQPGQNEMDNKELDTTNTLSTEQAIIIVGAIFLIIWHLTRTRDDVLPVKLPSDTNSLSEDEYIAMNTAESEYIAMAESYYTQRPAIPKRNTLQRYTEPFYWWTFVAVRSLRIQRVKN